MTVVFRTCDSRCFFLCDVSPYALVTLIGKVPRKKETSRMAIRRRTIDKILGGRAGEVSSDLELTIPRVGRDMVGELLIYIGKLSSHTTQIPESSN